LLQSAMGAWAVKYPQSAAVLALHFGFSLVAVAGVFLVMRVVDEQTSHRAVARPPVPKTFTALSLLSVVTVYVVAYSGAYIKHAAAAEGCRSWPRCDGQFWPGFGGDDGVIFMHRLAALGSMFLIVGIASYAYRFRAVRADLFNVAMLAAFVVICQAIVGGIVAASNMQLFSTLMHAGLMTVLFLTLCEGFRLALPAPSLGHAWNIRRRQAPAPQGAD